MFLLLRLVYLLAFALGLIFSVVCLFLRWVYFPVLCFFFVCVGFHYFVLRLFFVLCFCYCVGFIYLRCVDVFVLGLFSCVVFIFFVFSMLCFCFWVFFSFSCVFLLRNVYFLCVGIKIVMRWVNFLVLRYFLRCVSVFYVLGLLSCVAWMFCVGFLFLGLVYS